MEAKKTHFYKPQPWIETTLVLVAYLGLSIALTWPLIKVFTTAIVGTGDAVQMLWHLWHDKLAFLGQEPFFTTKLLYYPYGANIITVPMYPLNGVLTLPFWPLGPEAAYNGTLLLAFTLTGFATYFLGRALGFEPSVAFFTGVVVTVFPMHMTSVYGHLTKALVAFVPLFLLALLQALKSKNIGWSFIVPLVGLALLFSSVEQFAIMALTAGVFVVFSLLMAKRSQILSLIARICLIGLLTLILISWYIPKVVATAENPDVMINTSAEAYQHQPDLIQFFIPHIPSLLSQAFSRFNRYDLSPIETAVYLGWITIILSLIGVIKCKPQAWQWGAFTLTCILLALGPDLKFLGQHYLKLPYHWLSTLPGFQSMRTPGRFMLVGSVGLAMSAGYGLSWLRRALPANLMRPFTILIIALSLFENWPALPWAQTPLRPVPEFYKQIGQDPEEYGVFDLPLRPFEEISHFSAYFVYATNYQWYQMTHHKGIASGYIRPYNSHPLFGQFVSNTINASPLLSHFLVNGNPANRFANVRYELAKNNYRYVVVHKPQPGAPYYEAGSWADIATRDFINEVFGQQPPIVNDNLVTVYEVGSISDTEPLITTTMAPFETVYSNWVEFQTGEYILDMPAKLYVAAPELQMASLVIMADGIGNQCAKRTLDKVSAVVQINDFKTSTRLIVGKPAEIQIPIGPGSEIVDLWLIYSKLHKDDNRPACYSLQLKYIDLRTIPNP